MVSAATPECAASPWCWFQAAPATGGTSGSSVMVNVADSVQRSPASLTASTSMECSPGAGARPTNSLCQVSSPVGRSGRQLPPSIRYRTRVTSSAVSYALTWMSGKPVRWPSALTSLPGAGLVIVSAWSTPYIRNGFSNSSPRMCT